ncbi:MAG: calcium-binding protein, partial [Sedimenticolaceae bacterium]
DHDQAWFSRNGDDLIVSVIGANDQVRIDEWFSSPSDRLEWIRSADGKLLADTSVEQLVSAMAAFNPSQAGILDGTVQVTESLRLEITAAWQAS